jgi:hypothetical protein
MDPEISKYKLRIQKANLLRIRSDPDPTWQFLWSFYQVDIIRFSHFSTSNINIELFS